MAGVDLLNQFPNSKMARAVKVGQSRFQSSDEPSTSIGSQMQLDISTAKALTVPAGATYAVITAVGGPLYYTTDGSDPSAANFAGTVAAGGAVPFYGADFLAGLKLFGTSASVVYMQ
jgi:hypothetical protein